MDYVLYFYLKIFYLIRSFNKQYFLYKKTDWKGFKLNKAKYKSKTNYFYWKNNVRNVIYVKNCLFVVYHVCFIQ